MSFRTQGQDVNESKKIQANVLRGKKAWHTWVSPVACLRVTSGGKSIRARQKQDLMLRYEFHSASTGLVSVAITSRPLAPPYGYTRDYHRIAQNKTSHMRMECELPIAQKELKAHRFTIPTLITNLSSYHLNLPLLESKEYFHWNWRNRTSLKMIWFSKRGIFCFHVCEARSNTCGLGVRLANAWANSGLETHSRIVPFLPRAHTCAMRVH